MICYMRDYLILTLLVLAPVLLNQPWIVRIE